MKIKVKREIKYSQTANKMKLEETSVDCDE